MYRAYPQKIDMYELVLLRDKNRTTCNPRERRWPRQLLLGPDLDQQPLVHQRRRGSLHYRLE